MLYFWLPCLTTRFSAGGLVSGVPECGFVPDFKNLF